MATGSSETSYRRRRGYDSHGHAVPRAPTRAAGALKPRRRWHYSLRSAAAARTGRVATVTLETTDGGRRRHDQNGSAVGSVDKIAACNFEHRRRRHDDGCSPSQARRTGKRVLCSEGDLRRWPDDLQMSKADARSLVSGSTDRRWGWHDGGCSSTQGRLGRTGKRALGITGDLGC